MQIKELAEQAGVSVKAVRYYEARGLIAPQRATNGYRRYDDEDVRVVREIRALLSLGLTAEQTHPFVECLRAGNEASDSCADSFDMYSRKLAEVDAQIARLQAIRDALLIRQAAAAGRDVIGCRAPLDIDAQINGKAQS